MTPGAAGAGRFVAFEGPEGAGKSTQVAELAARLRAEGHPVLTTREPGGSAAGERIRRVILDPDLAIEPLSEFLLYAAARAQHVRETIRPALARGEFVLCDRYAASSLAYQGHGRGLELAFVRELNRRATGGLTPDATVLLDLPSQEGLARTRARGASDRLERADPAFHDRVRDGFLSEARLERDWIVLDARRPAEALAAAVWDRLAPIVAPRQAGAS